MYIFKALQKNPSVKISRRDETALNFKNNDEVCLGHHFIIAWGVFNFC